MMTGDLTVARGKERFRESAEGLKKKNTRSYWLAIVASWAAVVLSILPVFGTTEKLEYDPTIAVLTATLIALIWTAYHTFQSVSHERVALAFSKYVRSRSREFLSNAVLIEAYYLERAINAVVKDIGAYDAQTFARPRLSEAMQAPDLVTLDVGALVTAVDSHLRLIEGDIRLWRLRKDGKTSALMAQASQLERTIAVDLNNLKSDALARLQHYLREDASIEVLELIDDVGAAKV